MDILVTNTLTKKKEIFNPIKEGHVGIYSCGPTVYHYAHIGNIRAYLTADLLKRMFLFNNYKVNHVMNITDVGHLTSDADEGEDKMEKGAKREGKTVWEIADFYTNEFIKDMDKMNILPPKYTKATDHIKEMIQFIKKIEKHGFTYISEGNVYFDTSKINDYQKLIGGRLKDEHKKTRVGHDAHKKSQTDFVLWFTRHKYGDHAMVWDSPWGEGFPGWHIECSAMSNKYLGETFDIHTGAVDLMPTHHSNEIAQCQGALHHDPVNYWIHNEFLVMSEGKMSKSSGDFVKLSDLIAKGYSADDYRYLLLGSHYRKKMLFSYEVLDSAKTAMTKLKNKIKEFLISEEQNETKLDKKEFEKYEKEFNKEINDDINTPRCLAILWEVINSNDLNPNTKLQLLYRFDEVLGLRLSDVKPEEKKEIPHEILELKKKRDKARESKDWKKSDEIRDELASKGYKVLDSKEGSEVKKI
jgi:cysteinyl-tRNA synthetase